MQAPQQFLATPPPVVAPLFMTNPEVGAKLRCDRAYVAVAAGVTKLYADADPMTKKMYDALASLSRQPDEVQRQPENVLLSQQFAQTFAGQVYTHLSCHGVICLFV